MESPAPADPRSLLPLLVAGAPAEDVARATSELTALTQTPDGALSVMRSLLEWVGGPDAAAECDREPPASRRGEALSLLAWALADQRHDDQAEQVAKTALELGVRHAATDALMLVCERRGREAEGDQLVSRLLGSDDDRSHHPLRPMQRAALAAWNAGDLVRATNLSRALVERSPADVEALFRAGYGLYAAGQWSDALPLLERYRKWTEQDADALLPIAGCLCGVGRYDDAMALLGQIVAQSDGPAARLFLAWVQIAWNELGKGLLERAEGAIGNARAVLEQPAAVDDELVGAVLGDLDAIEGVIDALAGQLDLAHRTLTRMRRAGSPSSAILEEAIADVESGRVVATGIELPRHRRQRPRGPLGDRLATAKAGEVVDLENGTWEAGNVVLPPGVILRGHGPDTILQGSRSPVLVSRGTGAALEQLSVILSGSNLTDDHVAVLVEGGDLRLSDTRVEAKRGVAVSARLDAHPLVERSELSGGLGMGAYDNAAPVVRGGRITSGAKRFGVLVAGQATGQWRDVEISQTGWACVRVIGTAAPTFAGCKVHGSKGGSGFWIGEDARGSYEGNEVWEHESPGFLADDRARPELRGNRIHHQTCAAIQLAGQSEATVENNEIDDVEAALIECLHESKGTVRNNTMRGGVGPGIWVLHKATPTLEGNRIEGTRRSGIEVAYSACPTVRKCVVERSQGAGIRITESAGSTIEDVKVVECLSGIDVSGSATPVLRGTRVEKPVFAGLVVGGGATVKVEGLTVTGGKVGLDFGGRSVVEASGVRLEGVEATPVQVGAAARATLVGTTLEPPRTSGPGVTVGGGADLMLRDATVKAGSAAAAIVVRAQGVVRIDGGTVQGSGRTPVLASDNARVRVRVAAIVGTGGVAIDATGQSGVATEDARIEGDVRVGPEGQREDWAEPPSPEAHAAVVLLCRGPVDDAAISAALGDDGGPEGHVRFTSGRSAPPRAGLWPLAGEDGALRDAVREAGAWVEVHRKSGVAEDAEVAEMRKFAHAVLRVVRAAGATAVWTPAGARLLVASTFTREAIDGAGVGRLFCAVRATPVGSNVLVETVGLESFGQTDVQCESAPEHRSILEPILWSFVDAIVTGPSRYGYRSVTNPVGDSPQTFMLPEPKHDLAPPRKVWSLQPIGDLAAGGGWAKQTKQAWGKAPAKKGFGEEPPKKGLGESTVKKGFGKG